MRKILLLGKDENGKYIQHIRGSKMSDSKQKFEQLEEEAKSYSGLGPKWEQSDTSQLLEPTKYYLVTKYKWLDGDCWCNDGQFISTSSNWQNKGFDILYKIDEIELK